MRGRLELLTFFVLLACLAPQGALAESLAGKWNLVWNTEGGIRRTVWVISQEGEAVSVETAGQQLKGTFAGGRLEVKANLYSAEAGYTAEMKLQATLENGRLKGKGDWDGYALTFTGERDQ